MMGHFSRAALDSYITGNYGEDQFEGDVSEGEIQQSLREQAAWAAGQQACGEGKPIGANPFLSRIYRAEWVKGWTDEDMSIQASHAVISILGPETDPWKGGLILSHPLFGKMEKRG